MLNESYVRKSNRAYIILSMYTKTTCYHHHIPYQYGRPLSAIKQCNLITYIANTTRCRCCTWMNEWKNECKWIIHEIITFSVAITVVAKEGKEITIFRTEGHQKELFLSLSVHDKIFCNAETGKVNRFRVVVRTITIEVRQEEEEEGQE